jgi:hypothetical protein
LAYELFHEVAQPASAQARKLVSEYGLLKLIRFRNVFYPEVQADFAARGGRELPAIWDGTTLVQGGAAVLARLAQIRDSGA